MRAHEYSGPGARAGSRHGHVGPQVATGAVPAGFLACLLLTTPQARAEGPTVGLSTALRREAGRGAAPTTHAAGNTGAPRGPDEAVPGSRGPTRGGSGWKPSGAARPLFLPSLFLVVLAAAHSFLGSVASAEMLRAPARPPRARRARDSGIRSLAPGEIMVCWPGHRLAVGDAVTAGRPVGPPAPLPPSNTATRGAGNAIDLVPVPVGGLRAAQQSAAVFLVTKVAGDHVLLTAIEAE